MEHVNAGSISGHVVTDERLPADEPTSFRQRFPPNALLPP
jgi:hypothetical protein